jgi:hypothetical protein
MELWISVHYYPATKDVLEIHKRIAVLISGFHVKKGIQFIPV